VGDRQVVGHVEAGDGRGAGQIDHRLEDDRVMVTARFLVGTKAEDTILRVHEKIRANLDRIPVGIPEPLIVGPRPAPLVMSGRFVVVVRLNVSDVPGGPGRLIATPVPVGTGIPSGPMTRPACMRSFSRRFVPARRF
jgi:hypothetical protein